MLSIADEIVADGEAGSSFSPRLGIPEDFSYSFRFEPATDCSICGSPLRKKSKKSSVKRVPVYIADLGKSFLAMARAFELSVHKRGNYEVFRSKPVLFIGSGGSLSAAQFGEQLLLKLYGVPSKALTPFHLENLEALDEETPVCLLSYGGKNADIIAGALRVARANVKNCIVLCSDKNAKLARIALDRRWHLVELPGQERAFVSTVGMLAMISSLASILVPDEMVTRVSQTFEHNNLMEVLVNADKVAAELSRLVDQEPNRLHMVCLASGWGMPALSDFESKIVEGGICTIETAEMKNFTHGRYINTFYNRMNRALVIFETRQEKELSSFLQKKFERYVHPIIVVRTEKEEVSGALELMIKSLYLAWYIGKRKSRDIGSPHKYPPEARGLYGWEPEYRRGKDFNELLDRSK